MLNLKLAGLAVVAFFISLPTTSSRGVVSRAFIPFSTKYPDQIIPDESVCLPRRICKKNSRAANPTSNDRYSPWTNYVDSSSLEGWRNTLEEDEDEETLSGPVDLPWGADRPDQQPADDDAEGPVIAAVVAEEDNFLIEQCEAACPKDRADYCDYDGKFNYLGADHTMCKFCGLGEKCPYYLDPTTNDLTGRVIREFDMKELIVQLHNEVRSKIARGACEQPKAGCMGPLVWDDELARVAQKWADQCADVDYKGDFKRRDPNLLHDPHPSRKVADFSDWRGVGQNVARDISKGTAGTFNATSLVGHWFRQIRLFDPEGVKAFGSGDQCSLGVGYYTQMVWENTTHVGCGWTQFQYRGFPGYFENFLVCNYGPAANIWKDPVYTIAETTCDCPCVDCDQEAGMCPANPRYGSWSSWGSWGRCSRSCGGGEQSRRRACTAPNEDGTAREPCPLCKGEGLESQKCNVRKCPEWSDWTPWGECSVTCGEGERTRYRVCGDGDEEEGACPGENVEYEACNPGACPAWTSWTPWSTCTATCGGGTRKRLRECGVERSSDCIGEAEEEEECNTKACPSWTDWSDWSPCTKSCGGGRKTKVRECIEPKSGSSACEGEREVTEDCNINKCPDWTPWTDWTPCTKSCGGGTRSRERDCVIDDNSATGCVGDDREEEQCNEQVCPVWTEWTEWTECSATCGGGIQSRTRECVLPRGVQGCVGEPEETRKCNSNKCPVWTEWTEWTPCTASCGGGTRYKVRDCVLPPVRGVLQCTGDEKVTETCNDHSCPILTPWSDWTECSASCGGGTRYKRRECVYPKDASAAVQNDCRETLELSEACNEQKCPEFGEWSDWTTCTRTCGGGTRKKVRECVQPRSGGVKGCVGDAEVEEECNTQKCPVWTDWTEWTTCTATCGGGRQKRSRECVLPESRAFQCAEGESEEERACNTQTCPDWTDWTEWTPCSASCGGGTRTKVRECVLTERNSRLQCDGDRSVTEECNTQKCPIWTDWSEWTECTKTCGGGKRSKVRECVLPKSSGGCEGDSELTEDCNESACPAWTDWTEWTECSATCGGGTRRRSRDCVQRDGACVGDDEEVEECNTRGCPGWSPWSEWSNCSEPCGGGFRERERQCLVDGVRCICEEEKLCVGNFKEGETCNEEACATWTSWSSWSQCSASCGIGSQTRKRTCKGLGVCSEGPDSEERECKLRSCVSWSEWGSWSACSASCGEGIRERVRKCGNTVRYLSTCPGPEKETETCQAGACATWSDWSTWSGCSATCGKATKQRSRECRTDPASLRSAGGVVSPCPGLAEQTEECNNPPCKGWSEWSRWSACSRSCGGGTRQRERTCSDVNPRLGLLLSPCPGASQESETCSPQPCPTTTQAPLVGCEDFDAPAKFFGFNGKEADNIADCSWDYFGCTKRYGSWPSNKQCCSMRYKQCCMQVMGMIATTTAAPAPAPGYGPQIDIELDIDLGNLDNPIDDIDLGNGTGVQRPETAASVAEIEDDEQAFELEAAFSNNFVVTNNQGFGKDVCRKSASDKLGILLADPADCTRFISCQRRNSQDWIVNPMSCPQGTGFDRNLQTCNYLHLVPACTPGRRRARILSGFDKN